MFNDHNSISVAGAVMDQWFLYSAVVSVWYISTLPSPSASPSPTLKRAVITPFTEKKSLHNQLTKTIISPGGIQAFLDSSYLKQLVSVGVWFRCHVTMWSGCFAERGWNAWGAGLLVLCFAAAHSCFFHPMTCWPSSGASDGSPTLRQTIPEMRNKLHLSLWASCT